MVLKGFSIVCNDGGRNAKMTNEMVKDKFINLGADGESDESEQNCFHPFGEILDSGNNKLVFVGEGGINFPIRSRPHVEKGHGAQ